MKREIPYGVINWETLVRDCYVVEVCSSRGYNWFEIATVTTAAATSSCSPCGNVKDWPGAMTP